MKRTPRIPDVDAGEQPFAIPELQIQTLAAEPVCVQKK
jgi:hypothetical protein